MAIIYSYPTLVPQLGDKVLGSNIVDSAGQPVLGNPTVQYTLNDIKLLVDQQYVQQLSAFNPNNTFDPGYNNTGSIITFGAAQGTGTSAVMLGADGRITFNLKGAYSIQQIYYGQGAINNNVILNFKMVDSNGTQVGPTSTTRFLSNNTLERHRIEINSYIQIPSTAYYYLWMQNPTSGAAGQLANQVTDAAWGTDVPPAQLIITKLQ